MGVRSGRDVASVNAEVEAWIEGPHGSFALTSQVYGEGVVHPDGATRIRSFRPDPWPTWVYQLGGQSGT